MSLYRQIPIADFYKLLNPDRQDLWASAISGFFASEDSLKDLVMQISAEIYVECNGVGKREFEGFSPRWYFYSFCQHSDGPGKPVYAGLGRSVLQLRVTKFDDPRFHDVSTIKTALECLAQKIRSPLIAVFACTSLVRLMELKPGQNAPPSASDPGAEGFSKAVCISGLTADRISCIAKIDVSESESGQMSLGLPALMPVNVHAYLEQNHLFFYSLANPSAAQEKMAGLIASMRGDGLDVSV